jgi:two-component system nitrate/nitrite response regulator NarL
MQYVQRPGEETIRVLVVDDTRIHTQLLADALRRDRRFDVISSPSHSRDLIEVANQHNVDVVVISSNLDEEPLRGFDVLRELRAKHPDLRAIVLLDSSKREAILQAFRAGARGIFSRHESVETLSKCVRSVHQGQIWADSQQMSVAVEALASAPTVRAVGANGLNLLSKRELDVVRSLAEGLTNREIAERLGLSQHTIKNYLFRVFDKLGVSNRLELLFMTLTQAAAPPLASRTSFENPTNGNGEHQGANSDPALKSNRVKAAVSATRTSLSVLAGIKPSEEQGVRLHMPPDGTGPPWK